MKYRPTLVVPAALLSLTCPAIAQGWQRPVFDAPLVVSGPSNRSMVEVLDFDGDGLKDVLTVALSTSSTAGSWQVRIDPLQGPGPGYLLFGFAGPLAYEPISAVGELFAPDGKDDCFIAFGAHTFALRHGLLAQSFVAPANVDAAVIGDFDGDGLGDVAMIYGPILAVRLAGPNNTFAATLTTTLSATSGRLLVRAEVTGDAHPDLVVVGSSAEFFSVAGGQLTAIGSLPVGVANPMPVAGDIDGDGDEDLAVFGDTDYVVLRRTGPTSFVPEPPITGGPATHLYDVDGDGDLDGACCGSGGSSSPFPQLTPTTFRVSLNDNGVFAPAYELPGIGGWHLAGVVDVDLDGLADLVAGRTIYFARSSLATAPNWPTAGVPWPVAVADLDADGDPDWITDPIELHRNAGDGEMSVHGLPLLQPPAGGQYAPPVIVGDFDGDGDADLIVEVRSGGVAVGARLLLQRGSAFDDGGAPFPAIVTLSPFLGDDPARCLVADLDGDGDLDLIANSAGAPLWSHHWHNDGAGSFTFRGAFGEHAIAVRDFTRDGAPDLLVSDGRLRLRRGTAGGFTASEPLTSAGPPSYFEIPNSFDPLRDTVACADFDGDGNLDVLAGLRVGINCPLALLRGAGAAIPPFFGGSTGWPTEVQAALGCRLVTGDIDGDGHLDVVIGSPVLSRPDSVRIEFGTGGPGVFSAQRSQTLLAPIHALADVDGDGDLDGLGAERFLGRIVEDAGARRQWGAGSSGAAGIELRLGASLVGRAGIAPEFRIAGAPGQTWGGLGLGWQTRALPMLGGTSWIDPLAGVLFACGGPAGAHGEGRAAIALPPLSTGLVGATIQLQAFAYDPSATFAVTLSNALSMTVGN